jgi:hypothetical protein
MQISFMRILLPRINADTRESDHIRVYLRSSTASFLFRANFEDRFRGSILILRGRISARAVGAQILFSLAVIH